MMNETLNELAELLMAQCWQLTALIAITGLLGVTILKKRAHLMHVLWVIVILKSLTLPVWSSPVGVFSWIQSGIAESIDDRSHDPVWLGRAHRVEISGGDAMTIHVARQSTPAAASDFRPTLVAVLFCVWGAGAVIVLAVALTRWIRMSRRFRDEDGVPAPELQLCLERLLDSLGVRTAVELHITESQSGPMVLGFFRPVIILPRALVEGRAAEQIEPVLAHELLHVRRWDTFFGLLQTLAFAVWWFHPLVWWANRQASRTCERCCDEEVVANLGCRPIDYARSLVDVLEMRSKLSPIPAIPGIHSGDVTSARLQNIVLHARSFLHKAPRRYLLYALLAAVIVLPGSRNDIDSTTSSVIAQEVDSIRTLSVRAKVLVSHKNWKDAAASFRALVERNPSDGRAWFMLGYCLHAEGRLDEAIPIHQRAAEFPATRPVALYNLACAHALREQTDDALKFLRMAIDEGFYSVRPISEDSDFDSIKDDPRFLELAEAARHPAERDVYRQLDFRIGAWDVFNNDGDKVGTNVVTKDEAGFLLTEKWTNRHGGTGTSINYYDPSDKQWKQTWVDADGNVVQYHGRFAGMEMSLEGRRTGPNGSVVRSRVSYTLNRDGSIRQVIEHSSDNGATWQPYFDGRYVRRPVTEATSQNHDGASVCRDA